MIEIDGKEYGFRTRSIWFSDSIYDAEGVDRIYFCSIREPLPADGFERQDLATMVMDLDGGLDGILGRMTSKCRSAVRKSERSGVEVVVDRYYEQFLDLHHSLASSKGIKPLIQDVEFMKKYGHLLCAEEDGEIIGGIFFLVDDSNMRGYVSANRRLSVASNEASKVSEITRLLWWEAAKYAKERGLDHLDMGGYYIGSKPDKDMEGINEFKRRLGGRVVDDYLYFKDYSLRIKAARAAFKPIRAVKQVMMR